MKPGSVQSNPDVFVTYFASVNQEVVLHTTGMAHGVGAGWGRSGWRGMGSMHTMQHTATTSSTVNTGVLDIDIWDARADELVWRGQVSDTITSNPDQIAAAIDRGVQKVFQRFPPK